MCFSAPSYSERHDDITEKEMPVSASGGIYPPLDPKSKSEVGMGTEMFKVAEPAVTSVTRNQFVPGLTGSNKGEGNSVDPDAVLEGESELQGKKDPGIPYCRK